MKIIQINVLADQGSTGKIVACVDAELRKRGVESLVCFGRKTSDVPGRFRFGSEVEAALSKVASRMGRLMYASSPLATRKLLTKIKAEKPDIVHIHCLNGFCVDIYSLLAFLAKNDIPTVVTHHAEFYYTGSCGHSFNCTQFMRQKGCKQCNFAKAATGSRTRNNSSRAWQKMRNAFNLFKNDRLCFTAVSPWVKERALKSPIVNSFPCEVVENGIDTSMFRPIEENDSILDRVPGCKDRVILNVTASFTDEPEDIKGGCFIIELARRMPEFTFIVAASFSSLKNPLPDNLCLWGRTKDQKELTELYNAADVTVIASRRETFSMIVAESLCCGTPIVGFKAGGPESIAIPEYSEFVDYGDVGKLELSIRNMIDNDFQPDKISAGAMKKFSEATMTEGYISVYSKLLGNENQ